jgi:hypothetical protein
VLTAINSNINTATQKPLYFFIIQFWHNAPEKSNWQEAEFPTIFFPEDPVKQSMLLAGLLAHLFSGPSRPSVAGQWQCFRRNLQVYSSGDCSGFAPDSLIKALSRERKESHQNEAKVENYSEEVFS